MTSLSQTAREQLTASAEKADRCIDWPTSSWSVLKNEGILRRSIPAEFGGIGSSAVDLLRDSEAIAECCLTTAFILSQREAALRSLLKGPSA